MTKEEIYRFEVRSYARQLEQGRKDNPELDVQPTDSILMDDVSVRYEKTLIKKLVAETDRMLENLYLYGVGESIEFISAMQDILNARYNVLHKLK